MNAPDWSVNMHVLSFLHSRLGVGMKSDRCSYFSSSVFPIYICVVRHFYGEIFAYVRVFSPTIEVITFRLRGWGMQDVFLLKVFTRLRHEC